MLEFLQTEARNPASHHLDEMTPLEIVRLMISEDRKVPQAVATQENPIAQAIAIIAEHLRQGGRLIYLGAGTSGRLGVLDATECPPTFQSPIGQVIGLIAGGPSALTQAVEGAEDKPELAVADLQAVSLTTNDVVVGIATSGRTPYVVSAMIYAKSLGCPVLGISCNESSEIARLADIPITPIVGPEILTGSTRLKAGTATKLVLNMLSTGAMVRLGKAFGHLMVDLKASNVKLRDRAQRIVREIAGVNDETAKDLLHQCQWEVKSAILVHRLGVAPVVAREKLETVHGQLRLALAPSPSSIPRKVAQDFVLGIDGGGTQTTALLADRLTGRVLGQGTAGPANVKAVGWEAATASLTSSIANAYRQAGLPIQCVATACFGLAGAGRPDVALRLKEWALQAGIAEFVEITTDASLVLSAGLPDQIGLAVIAGTGSMVLGISMDGRTVRAGGWGYLLGDEGSAYQIVLEALRVVAKSADGDLPATLLTDRFLSCFQITEPQQIITLVHEGIWTRSRLAQLAPHVIAVAQAGDLLAMQVLQQQLRGLAASAHSVVQKLGWSAQPLPIALAGGVMVGSEHYRAEFLRHCQELGMTFTPVNVVDVPARGAIQMAQSLCKSAPELS